MSSKLSTQIPFISMTRRQIVMWLRARPWIYVPLRCSMAKDADGVSRALNCRTQLIIDAFPRSGNSFAVVAFQSCQQKQVAVAHHYHAAATIIYGARRSIPSLTIIRNPDDACISHAIFMGSSNLRSAFHEYISFYNLLLPLREKIVVAKFETVVTDFGAVIDKVNEVYGSSFTSFDHTPENVALVKSRLANRTTRRFGENALSNGHGETPTAAKAELKTDLVPMLHDESLQDIRRQAHILYKTFDSSADI